MIKLKFYYIFLLFSIVFPWQNICAEIKIINESNVPQVSYAVQRLQELTKNTDLSFVKKHPNLIIRTRIDAKNLGKEAFRIKTEKAIVEVIGGDGTGLMYGLLDVREQILNGTTTIEDKSEAPNLPFRAIKFNLPWSTYRNGEALDLHIETCRDTFFWKSFLDMMVENRLNKLTLWNLHPFNYMVKLKKYPEANGFSDQEMQQWETFWKTLFAMAKKRGVETYLVNWNIFVSPEFAKAHHVAEYSISNKFLSDGDTSEIVKDYTRESVRAVIDKYPDLTGLGITLGEGMGGMTAEGREKWLLDAYIAGVRMASRKIKFIHRVPLSADKGSGGSTSTLVETMTRETLDTLTCFDGPINIELKFNWSHAFSTPYLAKVHGGKLTDAYWNPNPKNYKLAWMMRNEDFFMLRWGQTDFIRKHIEQNAHEYVNGYFIGSESYIPAKDYITALPGASYKYAFQRQWMFYKNWGRLLYNPQTPDKVFENAFEQKFPKHGTELFDAQQKVSKVPLIFASYMNATWDFTLYSEGLMTMEQGKMKLISLLDICKTQPMDPSYMGIQEYLESTTVEQQIKITPIQMADSIDIFCNFALKEVGNIDLNNNVDLTYEVSDIKAWAYLGLHFSNKLRGAVAYQHYLNTKNRDFLNDAIKCLEKGKENWLALVAVTTPIYKPVPLMPYTKNDDKYFHWSNLMKDVKEEMDWLKNQ